MLELFTENPSNKYFPGFSWPVFWLTSVPVHNSTEDSFALDIEWEGVTNGYSGGADDNGTLYTISSNGGAWSPKTPKEATYLKKGISTPGGEIATEMPLPKMLPVSNPVIPVIPKVKKGDRPGEPEDGYVPVNAPSPPEVPDIPVLEPIIVMPAPAKSWWTKALDGAQLFLDVAGFAGPVGPFADGLNAGISLLRGDFVGAGVNVFAIIPVIGDGIKAGKMVAKTGKAAGMVSDAVGVTVKHGDNIIDAGKQVAKNIGKNADEAVGAVKTKPPYKTNPQHDPHSPLFKPGKTPEPSNAAEVFRHAKQDPNKPGTWYAIHGKKIYEFASKNNRTAHFTGYYNDTHAKGEIKNMIKTILKWQE